MQISSIFFSTIAIIAVSPPDSVIVNCCIASYCSQPTPKKYKYYIINIKNKTIFALKIVFMWPETFAYKSKQYDIKLNAKQK